MTNGTETISQTTTPPKKTYTPKLAYIMGSILYERTGQTRVSTGRFSPIPEEVKALGLEREYLEASSKRRFGRDPTGKLLQIFPPSDRGTISQMISGSVIQSEFAKKFVSTYQHLPYGKRASFNIRFFDWKSVPAEDIRYIAGGKTYLKTHRDDVVSRYIASMGGVDPFISSQDIVDIAHKISVYGGSRAFTGKEAKSRFAREYAYDVLTMDEPTRREFYFSELPASVRWYSSFFHATVSTALFPVTLAQAGVKYLTGEGDLTNILGRIRTGKTMILPDISEQLYKHRTGGPSGGISTLVSEGVGVITGEGSQAGELFQKHPVSGFFATVGEVLGLYVGGKGVHAGKVSMYKGLGYVRKGIIKYLGVELPSYARISYYFPQRYIRRWWIKKGTENIDDVLQVPYHSSETLTHKGLSFAKGKTSTQRIKWTIQKAKESRELIHSKKDILLGSGGASRIGKTFHIKDKTLHELPSLSATPYGFTPTRFYRFEGPALAYKSSFSLFPRIWKPTGLAIRIEKLYAPLKGSYEKITSIIKGQPKGKWGMVGPKMLKGGPETEINIFAGTTLKRIFPKPERTILQRIKGYQYYAKVPLEKGTLTEVVPVVFTRVKHHGFPSGFKEVVSSKIGLEVSEFIGLTSSYGLPSIPIINIKYFISSSMAYKPVSKVVSIPSSPSVPSSFSIPSSPSVPSSFSIPSSPSVPSSPSSIPPPPSSVSVPSSPSSIPPPPPPPPSFDIYWPSGKGKKIPTFIIPKTVGLGYRIRKWKVAKIESMLDFNKIGNDLKL